MQGLLYIFLFAECQHFFCAFRKNKYSNLQKERSSWVFDMMGIGERIKTRRKELKLSQTDIYERCDITSGALSKIENGKTTPSVIAFYKLSQVLECDMNWLATRISSNMQKSNICKLEEELLNGFREPT